MQIPLEIASTLGISRKRLALVIAEAKPTEADPVPEKAQRQGDFQGTKQATLPDRARDFHFGFCTKDADETEKRTTR